MIPKECKRLIEVDFPIAKVSYFAAKEKDARAGHIPKIHIWPAARPTASGRSVLLGLLLPDPCDPNCPTKFKSAATNALKELLIDCRDDLEIQSALLAFIGNIASMDKSIDDTYLRVARKLVKAANEGDPPIIVDPFAGGGSIPLEALRLNCDAVAWDLNPVAALILKVVLEDIPRNGSKLIDELIRTSGTIKEETTEHLKEYYPIDTDGIRPVTYLWARTVSCETTGCGAEIPLMRSFWLSNKGKTKYAFRLVEVDKKTAKECPHISIHGEKTKAFVFEIFSPNNEKEVQKGTVSQARAHCPCCDRSLEQPRVRMQLSANNGGAEVDFDNRGRRTGGARLLAVVGIREGEAGRHYRLPNERDYHAIWEAQKRHERIKDAKTENGLTKIPSELLPTPLNREFTYGDPYYNFMPIPNYGIIRWRDLFTSRQKMSLVEFADEIRRSPASDDCKRLLALCFDKMIDMNTALCVWQSHAQIPAHLMSRYAMPMHWDFAESVPIAESSGSLTSALKRTLECMPYLKVITQKGTVGISDALSIPLPDGSIDVFFTDPPYYDAIPYADLSDFFYVWLKRVLPNEQLLCDPYDKKNPLTPKKQEIIETLGLLRGAPKKQSKDMGLRIKDKSFFEDNIAKSFVEGRRVLRDEGIGCVVFAHKTTEGWEALLTGIMKGGWSITASWPIATEMSSRLRARDSAVLATSIHLICRPRPENAPVGEWAEVLRELPKRVGNWMERLHSEGVRGADMVFACVGPALEIYSSYSSVETAEGRVVDLSEYLSKVWEVVGRKALENVLGTAEARARNGAVGVLEEDARLTALFLWTLQSTALNGDEVAKSANESDDGDEEDTEKQKAGYSLIFDVARRFSQPLGIDLPKWEGRIIETEKGVVRLLQVHERAKQLFGEEGALAMADRIEDRHRGPVQMKLFPDEGARPPEIKGSMRGRKAKADVSDEALKARHEATTLDKIHAAMLLQDSGRANALRALIEAEQQRGPEFMRLANALSALYPAKSEEKRLLDAMILSAPR